VVLKGLRPASRRARRGARCGEPFSPPGQTIQCATARARSSKHRFIYEGNPEPDPARTDGDHHLARSASGSSAREIRVRLGAAAGRQGRGRQVGLAVARRAAQDLPRGGDTRRAARGLPRDQCNTAEAAGQYCLGSRSRPRAVSALPPCVCARAHVRDCVCVCATSREFDRGRRVVPVISARAGMRAQSVVRRFERASGWDCPERSRGSIARQYRQCCTGPRRTVPARAASPKPRSDRQTQAAGSAGA
jgi:hypothetical protein